MFKTPRRYRIYYGVPRDYWHKHKTYVMDLPKESWCEKPIVSVKKVLEDYMNGKKDYEIVHLLFQ